MNSIWRIIILTFLLLLFAVAVFAEPKYPAEYEFILKLPLVAETTCDNHKQKEHPCELRVNFNDKKNVVFLVVYSKDKSKVIWISVNELLFGEGQILWAEDRLL